MESGAIVLLFKIRKGVQNESYPDFRKIFTLLIFFTLTRTPQKIEELNELKKNPFHSIPVIWKCGGGVYYYSFFLNNIQV